MKPGENVEKVRILVRTDHCLDIRMTVEKMNMDRDVVRRILT
jgi:hypothetical protein